MAFHFHLKWLLLLPLVLTACDDGAPPITPGANAPASLADAVRLGDVEDVRMRLVRDGKVDPTSKEVAAALAQAVEEGQVEIVKLLVTCGADVNAKQENGRSLLMTSMASAKGIAPVLLEHGADVMARDAIGRTPLHFAAAQERADMVEVLLKRKASVNAVDKNGLAPFHLAIVGGEPVLALLADNGADLNLGDVRGSTALHKAAATGNTAAIEWLIARGAEVNVKNIDGFTPLALARPEAAAVLKKHGGK